MFCGGVWVFVGVADFAGFAGVTGIADSGIFVVGLDGVGLVGVGLVGFGVVCVVGDVCVLIVLVLLVFDANYIVDVAEIVRRLKFWKNVTEWVKKWLLERLSPLKLENI